MRNIIVFEAFFWGCSGPVDESQNTMPDILCVAQVLPIFYYKKIGGNKPLFYLNQLIIMKACDRRFAWKDASQKNQH